MRKSINELSLLTGIRRDTITRRLNVANLVPDKDGEHETAGKLYDTIKALPVIYQVAGAGEGEEGRPMNPTEASMQLNVAKKKEIDLKMEIIRKERIPIEAISDVTEQAFQEIAAILKGLKNKIMSEEAINDCLTMLREVPCKLKWMP